MQPLAIPAWIWLNLVILIAAVVFVRIKLGAQAKATRQGRPAPQLKRTGGVAPGNP